MPYKIDNKGYQPETPLELREKLLEQVKEKIPDFTEFSAELRNNLLDEGATFLVYVENLITTLYNWYSPSQAPQLLFEMFANEQGLRRKGAYESQVNLKFTGEQGFLIPQDTQVTNGNKTIIFKTYEEVIIGTTGEVNVVAYCDDDNIPEIEVGELNTLVLNLDLQVSNIDKPTKPIEEESFSDFKLRCQNRWRNPKIGTYERLVNEIKGIDGVLQRGCTYKITDDNSINLVVSGGSLVDIATAIYRYGGITTKAFVSNPSNSEADRTKEQNIIVMNNSHTYKWTEAKPINLYIKIDIKLKSITASSLSIQNLTEPKMIDYVNNLQVGTPVNKLSITQNFLNGFQEAGGEANNISQDSLIIKVKNNDTQGNIDFDSDGYLQANFDEYFVLTKYEVEIVG